MKITPNTKIAELIKENNLVIEALASMTKAFELLRMPIVRKLMAGRSTVLDATRIGKCSLTDFKVVLTPLGFECVGFEDMEVPVAAEKDRPDWLVETPEDHIQYLDVRETIATGQDPLSYILKSFKTLENQQVLCIINSFIPKPLIEVLEKKGAHSFTLQKEESLFYTWFANYGETAQTIKKVAEKEQSYVTKHTEQSFYDLLMQHDNDRLSNLDVRHLHMPEPMMLILQTLESMPTEAALYVQHVRIPIFLIDELANQRYAIHIYEAGADDIKILLIRK